MKAVKIIGIGAAVIVSGWTLEKILGHTGTILGWLLDPIVWSISLLRWLMTPLRWVLELLPLWVAHGFTILLLIFGVGLIIGRAAVLGLRSGDRRLRKLRHQAVKENIAQLETKLLAEEKNQHGVSER